MSIDNGMINSGDDDYNDGDGEGKICRDFLRNVCNRGQNCKFIHPNDTKIRTEPIFCHDFQQSKCFRSTCKFIHCSREEEDHYKGTGELPEAYLASELGISYGIPPSGKVSRGGVGGRQNGAGGTRGRGSIHGAARTNWANDSWGAESEDTPLCKDFLKGQCDRPPGGCKYRHVDTQFRSAVEVPRRRPGPSSFYDSGPEAKRSLGYSAVGMGRLSDYDDYYNVEYSPNPPPPPPQQIPYTGLTTTQGSFGINEINFGRNGYGQSMVEAPAVQSYTSTVAAPGMKALEDENFMLKRRIEELKKQVNDLTATNEYLLSQNAHFRLTGMAKDGNSAAAVVQTLVSMSQAQPLGLTMTPSLSVASTPLSTMVTMPSVSMSMAPVSISQSLPIVSMAQHPASLNPGQSQSVYPMNPMVD